MSTKEKAERNENGPLNLYKKTILWTKLEEAMNELKEQHRITESLEKKIISKFDEIICEELSTNSKNKYNIKGKVTSFRNCDDIWIFYCKDVTIKMDKESLSLEKLKIIALDQKLKEKNKEGEKYSFNQLGEN